MPSPILSVVMITMPSRAHFRRQALACLLAQVDAPLIELVIATDARDHLHVEDAAALNRYVGVDNLKVVRGEWPTVPDKHNAAVAATTTPWFMFWDDDDWCAPTRLRTFAAAAAADDADIIGPRAIHYHELIGDRRATVQFTTAAHVVDGAAAIRRALWERAPFKPSRSVHPRAAHWGTVGDWIVQRVAHDRAVVKVVDSAYVAMIHGDNASTPARPFRVSTDGTETVLDGPLDYKIVGGRAAAAEIMGDVALAAYEAAFNATTPR
jgi:hypothetical protein